MSALLSAKNFADMSDPLCKMAAGNWILKGKIGTNEASEKF